MAVIPEAYYGMAVLPIKIMKMVMIGIPLVLCVRYQLADILLFDRLSLMLAHGLVEVYPAIRTQAFAFLPAYWLDRLFQQEVVSCQRRQVDMPILWNIKFHFCIAAVTE